MTTSRVLIVEGNPGDAATLRDMISAWGYETFVEPNGAAWLDKAKQLRPSVVIAGGVVSHLGRFDLLRHIRAQHPETPVILLTDQGSIEMALQAVKEEGAYHYFE